MSTDATIADPASTVLSYGTAVRATRIERIPHSGNRIWTRTAPLPDHRFARFDGAPPSRRGGPRFIVGRGDDATRTYDLPAAESLAATALCGGSERVHWPSVYRQWGNALSLLHRRGPARPSAPTAEPPARTRLRNWWFTPESSDARREHARSDFLGALTESARARLDDVLVSDLSVSDVVVHGWAGLGLSVLGPDGRVVVLLGEDVGRAPAEYDLGALIAQSVELAVFSPPGTAPSPTDMRTALFDGYAATSESTAPCSTKLCDHTIEHVVRHVCDFVQFAEFDDSELSRWSSLVNWLDQNSRSADR